MADTSTLRSKSPATAPTTKSHLPSLSNENDRPLGPVNQTQPTSTRSPAPVEKSNAQAAGPELCIESYTIAWICALQEEFQAARQMLDQKDFKPPKGMEFCSNDRNSYIFGKLGEHYVVVGCLPRGRKGTVSAANVVKDMIRSFPSVKFALMVGIGGGAPLKKRDTRLGDVVVSMPSGDNGGVVQLNCGAKLSNGLFQRRGHLNAPPDALLSATQDVQVRLDDLNEPDRIAEHIARVKNMPTYKRPTRDRLYRSNYLHQDTSAEDGDEDDGNWADDEDEDGCRYCTEDGLVRRPNRNTSREVTVHYGTIASDDYVMRDAAARDKHARDGKLKIHCFEMEAAGLVNNLPCLVIRGICHYSDSHKNDEWYNYAALAAAAYARELLLVLRPQMVAVMPAWATQVEHSCTLSPKANHALAQHQSAMVEAQQAQNFRLNPAKRFGDQRLAALRDGIKASDSSSKDSFEKAAHDHLPGTCEWLFHRAEFNAWVRKDSEKPVLWLNGKHGAGKTVLCAAATRRLPQLGQGTSSPAGNSDIKHSSPNPPSPVIIQTNPRRAGGIATHIFVDGLDEAEYAENPKREGANSTARPPDDVRDFVQFLIQEAWKTPAKVRVWLSSQPLRDIRTYVYDAKCHHMPSPARNKNPFAEFFFRFYLEAEVEESFLWASTMVDAFKEEVENDDDLVKLAKKCLPTHMSGDRAGTTALEVSEHFPHHPSVSKGRKANLDGRVILSLLTFAKRPLKMSEVIEAVAILTSGSGNNLRIGNVDEEKILGSCLSLVRHTRKMSDNRNIGLLRLSHSAVRTFLLEESAPKNGDLANTNRLSTAPSSATVVFNTSASRDMGHSSRSAVRMTMLCLIVIRAISSMYSLTDFSCTPPSTGSSISTHRLKVPTQFLQRRIELQLPKLLKRRIELQSPDSYNHQTSSRAFKSRASLSLATFYRVSTPSPIAGVESGGPCLIGCCNMNLTFIGSIRPSRANGVDCYRVGDPTPSAARKSMSRYSSFEFSKGKGSRQDGDSCQIHLVSHDGRHLLTAWIQTRDNQKQIFIEQWTLDGKSQPRLKSTAIMPFSATDTCIARYTLPCSQSFHSIPLVPRLDSVVPPDAIALRLDGSIIRLGSKMFRRVPAAECLNQEPGFREITGKSLGESWEEVCIREPFLVVCRRRVYREQPESVDEEREARRVEKMKCRMSASKSRSSGYLSNTETDSSRSLGLPSISSAEESWSEGLSSPEDPSSDEISSEEPDESDSDDIGDDQEGESQASVDDDSDIKSFLSARSDDSDATRGSGSSTGLITSQLLGTSSSSSSSEEYDIESDVSEDDILRADSAPVNLEPGGPVAISRLKGRINCDPCGKYCPRWCYHCVECSDNNFDLCERFVSRWNLGVKQELAVYRTESSDDNRIVFRYRKKYPIFLYDSPPVVHPEHLLVVWALSDSRLLFGDLIQNKCFEQKIQTAGPKKEKPRSTNKTTTTAAAPNKAPRARLCLNLHLLVLQISSTQPARTPPKLLAATSCRLGCSCARTFVPTLPFAFTWTASDLYLTMSDSYLDVYRVILPRVDLQKSKEAGATDNQAQEADQTAADSDQVKKAAPPLFRVVVPREKILLPRSSRNRSVQFFPARTCGTKATVIIGPRYSNPSPPIGVYLSEEGDLGGWVDLEEKADKEGIVYPSQKTLEGQLEEPWDDDQDCVLIPFDGY
ncbi:hypothetical protein QBC46DRAFT_448417 [Diplogelasinospora grovesii]|uniref:Nephrocystin 3-like N-terminal domain-containing protein n=1 Tax=Diplogelasinospora grovesii TaxID=303347 RepID=A0AAN6S6K4_9PEZI|nr:hypothetical protein QBC46DRAFT_448417 [Diplogelasinospora grovesii]